MTWGLRRLGDKIDRAIETLGAGLLLLAALVAVVQVFFRYALNDSLPWPEEAALWAFVWAVFLGMARGVGRESHIAIDVLSRVLPPSVQGVHAFGVRVVTAAALWALVIHGVDFLERSIQVSPGLGWPVRYFYMAVPAGALLGLVQMCCALWHPTDPQPGRHRAEGIAAVLAGLLLMWGWGLVLGSGLDGVGTAGTLMGLALLLMLLQVPVVFALVFAAYAAFSPQGELMLLTIPQNMGS